MRKLIYFTVAVLGLSFAGCQSESNQTGSSGPDRQSLPAPGNNNRGTALADAATNSNSNSASAGETFWATAASSDMAEVELGKLAVQKAQNAEVKRFAEMMVMGHTKSSSEMKTLAQRTNAQLPAELDARHQAKLQQLQGAAGPEFDRMYVETMVNEHEAAVQLFESQASGTSDQEARAFAAKMLPALQKHLEMIKQIQMKLGRTAQGNAQG